MSLLTTCIGAYPKPDFVKLPDWFSIDDGPDSADPTKQWQTAMDELGADAPEIINRGIQQAIEDQVGCGIDIPTDGEIIRENYIHYHCRHLNGFDFANLTNKEVRGGNYNANLPSIVGPVSLKQSYITADWEKAQSFTDKPVKITLPGPMTVADTNADNFYHDQNALAQTLPWL
jgi:5-methyltetrahydropteroyltriglutamate--homocysteine methyltransferase